MKTLPLIGGLMLTASSAFAQSGCAIDARDPQVYFDKLSVAFARFDSALAVGLGPDSAALNAMQKGRLVAISGRVRKAFHEIAAKRSGPATEQGLWQDLGAHNDFVRLVLPAPTPAINALRCILLDSYIQVTQDIIVDHERKFHVRYGELSERLNIIEMLFTEIFQEGRAMGPLKDPSKLEPIARVQTFGFQYHRDAEKVLPSSPVYQFGWSYYFYSSGGAAKWINHIGLAGAYQKDLFSRTERFGGILHVRTYDIGVLCPRSGCDDAVIVGTKNLSAFSGLWTSLRQKLRS